MAKLEWTISQLVSNGHLTHIQGCSYCSVIQVNRLEQILVTLCSSMGARVPPTDIIDVKVVEDLVNRDEAWATELRIGVFLGDVHPIEF